ncbi:hypothetical protein, partial [Accumulibacter sp.]|uniref:hypothetical protein n=1 Tax=Accumulibacter sp. TaxID=2053492 RepID=UPI002C5D9B1E
RIDEGFEAGEFQFGQAHERERDCLSRARENRQKHGIERVPGHNMAADDTQIFARNAIIGANDSIPSARFVLPGHRSEQQ